MAKAFLNLVAAGLGLSLISGWSAAAAEEFYKGKTIRFIVGYAPGGGYDTYTRAIARHIGKHIPGHPAAVVENMEGAGSLLAANYMFNKAEPDGLTIGNFNSGMVTQQALGSRGVRFDARKFGWIGAPGKGWPTCMVMGFTGLRTLEDVIQSGDKLKFGGTRAGASSDDLPKLMNALMGTHLQVISGYKGTGPIRVALQRREISALCSGWESMRVTARAMLNAQGDDKLIPFVIHGHVEDPEVKDLPQFTQVIKGEENVKAFKAWANQYDFQRPLMVPPKTPKERLQVLRTALQQTVADPEFLAEAKKTKLVIGKVTGEDIERSVVEMLSITPAIKKKLMVLAPAKTTS
ncbi:MAG TPA: tripartite tricarboxylate transporter substrate-binding protein [Methylomirabilota bacterium]|nr:tripartite tricarboxylate transporter substrate-binding protein [Methylomirabilota bacterium]